MAKAFVIIKGRGAYSDRGTQPERVYLNQEKAQASMVALEEIEKRYYRQTLASGRISYEEANKLAPACAKEYLALGFEASIDDDWELAEAELIY